MRVRHEVTELDTALALGSGDVPVLATPRLIAWMEGATVRAGAELVAAGGTTVGTAVRIEHLRATAVGEVIEIGVSNTTRVDERRLTFVVEAVDGAGQLIARGEIDRAIVDRARFLARVAGSS